MEQKQHFSQLIQQCLAGNQEYIAILRFNIYTLIKQWSHNNMYETDWVARKNIVIKEEHFLSECFNIIFKSIQTGENSFQSYSDFKDWILYKTQIEMQKAFTHFYNLLLHGDNVAWSLIQNVMLSRCLGWIRKKGITGQEQITMLFNESIERFYEKFSSGSLKFENASKLKSYFFRILELRIMEHYRETKRHAWQELDSSKLQKVPFDQDIINDITHNEESEKIRIAIKKLSETERSIIVGYYYEKISLKEIADDLGKSEENIRVLKHRSLKKLMKILN
jgi:RNA polymerase sigma factor (sigma-70 family)